MIPHITIEQAKILCANPANAELWVANQNALIDAYNKANEGYITAEEARKLGAGKAEWRWEDGKWAVINELFPYFTEAQYRAIKQPEPVEPHAELKEMYEQQVKDGTLDDFAWEYKNTAMSNEWRSVEHNLGVFHEVNQYRCTPKPTCQVRNLDTGEHKTMTREKAKLLQNETKDVCDWFDGFGLKAGGLLYAVDASGIYTFKLKAKPWTGSREDVIALLNELGVTK